ncbi:gluconate 2-dehydrogenase subunit 3 family protein [Arcobacter sp. LA11]|uniref:gluconate 2-dehydrogenase subunit 3 family protein n=1 Tax=Arcobacter sp. LA11 TaxID=1898176 RepID=UPI000934009E|nr:gluconate 2-dehydrogenase subunit 3 family protein [Arcobacter sp. LA11]
MKRREFIVTSSILGASTVLNSQEFKADNTLSWLIIDNVFDILFPKTKTMPSAKEFNATSYLQINSKYKSFDMDDREYILQGALDFNDSFPNFLKSTQEQKENIIERTNNSEYGQEWLTRLVYYGIEAMLSDPIYGGNKNEIAWKSLNHQTGRPQPKYKYAKVV